VKKLVLVAIVLIIGLGFLGCEKKASMIGPQDTERSNYTITSAVTKEGPNQIDCVTRIGDCWVPDDTTIPAEEVTAVVRGNNVTVWHKNAPSWGCICPETYGFVVEIYMEAGNIINIHEYTVFPDPPDSACQKQGFKDVTVELNDLPLGEYKIKVSDEWLRVFTVNVTVNSRNLYDEPAND